MAAPILSREDIEQIAGRVLSIYTEAYVPERHLFYQVNPEELAEVLGLEVDYQIPVSYTHLTLPTTRLV